VASIANRASNLANGSGIRRHSDSLLAAEKLRSATYVIGLNAELYRYAAVFAPALPVVVLFDSCVHPTHSSSSTVGHLKQRALWLMRWEIIIRRGYTVACQFRADSNVGALPGALAHRIGLIMQAIRDPFAGP